MKKRNIIASVALAVVAGLSFYSFSEIQADQKNLNEVNKKIEKQLAKNTYVKLDNKTTEVEEINLKEIKQRIHELMTIYYDWDGQDEYLARYKKAQKKGLIQLKGNKHENNKINDWLDDSYGGMKKGYSTNGAKSELTDIGEMYYQPKIEDNKLHLLFFVKNNYSDNNEKRDGKYLDTVELTYNLKNKKVIYFWSKLVESNGVSNEIDLEIAEARKNALQITESEFEEIFGHKYGETPKDNADED